MASKANGRQMHSLTHLPEIKGSHSTTQCKINRKQQPTMGKTGETCLRFCRCLLWRWKWHKGWEWGLDNLQTPSAPTSPIRHPQGCNRQPSACLLIIRQRSAQGVLVNWIEGGESVDKSPGIAGTHAIYVDLYVSMPTHAHPESICNLWRQSIFARNNYTLHLIEGWATK